MPLTRIVGGESESESKILNIEIILERKKILKKDGNAANQKGVTWSESKKKRLNIEIIQERTKSSSKREMPQFRRGLHGVKVKMKELNEYRNNSGKEKILKQDGNVTNP